jgi:hypothetical protein
MVGGDLRVAQQADEHGAKPARVEAGGGERLGPFRDRLVGLELAFARAAGLPLAVRLERGHAAAAG